MADELGYSLSTVRHYACIAGFDALVTYYQERLFHEETQAHFHNGSIRALDALQDQLTIAAHEVEGIERALVGEERAAQRAVLLERLFSRSKAVVMAADVFLSNIGFRKYRERVGQLQAEQEIQGKHGQRVEVEASASDIAALLGLSGWSDDDEQG